MDLTFNKEGKNFVAEFEATADFNLHIERNKGGNILLYVRTQGGGYDIVDDFGVQKHQGVIDYDCTALVYPKWIKIVSEVEPTYAAVVSDGEVTEIKSQSKEVEIVSNGTTNISPDAGYSYLSGVSVKVNVPQEGGGDGMKYMNIQSLITLSNQRNAMGVAYLKKAVVDGATIIATDYVMNDLGVIAEITQIHAISYVPSMKVVTPDGSIVEARNFIESLLSAGAIEITEEEFYTIETA